MGHAELSEPITIQQARSYFPRNKGRKINVMTVYRRIIHGCYGVKLEAFKSGQQWYTTRAAIEKFQQDCTRRAMPDKRRPKKVREASHEYAKKQLTKLYGFTHGDTDEVTESKIKYSSKSSRGKHE